MTLPEKEQAKVKKAYLTKKKTLYFLVAKYDSDIRNINFAIFSGGQLFPSVLLFYLQHVKVYRLL